MDAAPPDTPVTPKRRGRPPKDPEAHAAKLALEAEAEAARSAAGEPAEAPKRRGPRKKTEQVNGIAFRGARQAGKFLTITAGMLRESTATKLRFDASCIGSPQGAQAIAKCVEKLAERNAKLATAIIRADENAGVAGAGTALILTVLVPILVNHEIIALPADARAMLGMPPVYPGEDEMDRDEPHVEPESD